MIILGNFEPGILAGSSLDNENYLDNHDNHDNFRIMTIANLISWFAHLWIMKIISWNFYDNDNDLMIISGQ